MNIQRIGIVRDQARIPSKKHLSTSIRGPFSPKRLRKRRQCLIFSIQRTKRRQTTIKDKTFNSTNCMAQSDVDAMNGDAKSIQAYLEKTIPPSVCKLSGVKANGNEVVYTSACGAAAPSVVTTHYHGSSFESTTTTGTKSSAKWTGACK